MKKEEKEKINKHETWQNLKKTWQFVKKYKKSMYTFLIFAIFISAIRIATPIINAMLVISLTETHVPDLIRYGLIIFVLEVTYNICRYISNKVSQKFFRWSLVDIQTAIAKETIRITSKEIDKNSSGTFVDRLNRDSSDVADMYTYIYSYITDILANIGVLVAIFLINKIMFIFFLIGLVIMFTFHKIKVQLMFAREKVYRELHEKNTSLMTELVRGIKDVKLANASDNFIERIRKNLDTSNLERFKIMHTRFKYEFFSGTTQDFLNLCFITLGVALLNIKKITAPNLVILFMYQNRVYNLIFATAQALEVFKKFNLAANRVFSIIENNEFQKEHFGTTKLETLHGDFEFKNVNFTYESDIPVINNLSFKVNANETVAFVGKSGSGKSTIFSLLTKLYEITNGTITIDGVNINDLDETSIRGNISIITQNPYIFNFSIKDNLNIVKDDLTEEEMIEACKLACIHDYIESLPNKYETVVGEGGITLSGGQRQRLAIARALIQKTEIILFDEATSALDNETQQSIQDAINNMKNEYTILIIAHRLSTVINSDRIIIIDNGHVVAEGTHEYLLNNNEIYQKLYNTELIEED